MLGSEERERWVGGRTVEKEMEADARVTKTAVLGFACSQGQSRYVQKRMHAKKRLEILSLYICLL